jgi:hypothetical protein
MKNLGDDLGGARNGHAGAVEIQIAVGEYDIALPHCLQIGPPSVTLQNRELTLGTFQGKATRGHDQILRVGVAQLFCGNRGRVFTLLSQQQLAVGDVHQFRSSVRHAEDRVSPFEHD